MNINIEMDRIEKKKEYECPYCKKKFRLKMTLRNHKCSKINQVELKEKDE